MHISGVVISDIRFPGEAKWLKDQGGTLWLIERPDNPHAIQIGHASELPIDASAIDETLTNDGDVDDLCNAIAELREKGVKFVHSPRPVNRGDKLELWSATFRDPDNHNIAITQWRAIR